MSKASARSPEAEITVVNPFDMSPVGAVPRNGPDDVRGMLEGALGLHGDRARWLGPGRCRMLEDAADLVEARSGGLVATVVRESGKTRAEATAEVLVAVAQLRACAMAAPVADARAANPVSGAGSPIVARVPRPAGVVVGQGEPGEPFGSAVRVIAPAVSAGCPVIAVPASETPLSCAALVSILSEAGLPEPWVQTVVTDDSSVVAALAGDPRVVRAPGCRTSRPGRGAAAVVAGDVDVYDARDILMRGGFRHSGQAEGSVQRVFAHTRVAARLATQLAMKASGIRLGDPADADTGMGPLIRPEEADRIEGWVDEAVSGGGQLLTGGRKLTATCYAPTVVFNPPPGCRLMTETAGGPVVCVSPWFAAEDAVARVNALSPARVAVCANDVAVAMETATALDAATVLVNDHTAFPAGAMPSGAGGDPVCDHALVVDWVRRLRTEAVVVVGSARPPPPAAEPA